MSGKLYLVGTPIGNLKDMTSRAIEVLNEVDLIAAEDTRNSIRLLNHFEIKKPMTSYHEYNRIDKAYEIVEEIKKGKQVALITDAGMPAVSDPGEDMVRIAYEEGVEVTIVPGASAGISALALSGLSTRRFAFEAFLPYDKKEREDILNELKNETRTIIIYEAPHKLYKTLSDLTDTLGGHRKISLVREITKIHEEVIRMTLKEAYEKYQELQDTDQKPKGEYVLVIEGKSREEIKQEARAGWDELTIEEHVKYYEDKGIDHKEAMRNAAKDRGISKRDVYQAMLGRTR